MAREIGGTRHIMDIKALSENDLYDFAHEFLDGIEKLFLEVYPDSYMTIGGRTNATKDKGGDILRFYEFPGLGAAKVRIEYGWNSGSGGYSSDVCLYGHENLWGKESRLPGLVKKYMENNDMDKERRRDVIFKKDSHEHLDW